MAGKGSSGSGGLGGGTSFESMSHEQMLAWLDQADSGTVQSAAEKLVAAAKEIREIANELKIRPQWVEWKGEGADAFRIWAGDLANSALRLADFSSDSGKWLSQASSAIATAQAAIPRDEPSATTNLAAAKAHHNDPDAGAIASKSSSELAALKANKENVRQEAAREMRKLAQAYDLSSTQMDKLERPKFPPPPSQVGVEDVQDLARPGTRGADAEYGDVITPGAGSSVRAAIGEAAPTGRSGDAGPVMGAPAEPYRPATIDHPAYVEIDSVGTLPETHHPVTGPGPMVGPGTPARPETVWPPTTTGVIPPTSGRGGGRMPTVSGGGGRPIAGGRAPFAPGQGGTGLPRGRDIPGAGPFPHGPTSGTAAGRALPGQGLSPGRNVPAASGVTGGRPTGPAVTGGRPMGPGVLGGRPASPGIVGGRPADQGTAGRRLPATPTAGKPSVRLPGGTVVGGESPANRGSAGPVPAAGATAAARPGATTNTGRPQSTPHGGVVGGTPQQTGRALVRPGAPIPSAPTRGGIAGGTPSEGGDRSGVRRAAGPANGVPRGQAQQTDRRNTSSPAD
ncbi:hypothetical protein SUDANB105_02702 [Streptomyces sp. enrichment culture]